MGALQSGENKIDTKLPTFNGRQNGLRYAHHRAEKAKLGQGKELNFTNAAE